MASSTGVFGDGPQRWFPCTGISWLWHILGSKKGEGGRGVLIEPITCEHLGLHADGEWEGCTLTSFHPWAGLQIPTEPPCQGLRLFPGQGCVCQTKTRGASRQAGSEWEEVGSLDFASSRQGLPSEHLTAVSTRSAFL